MGCSPPCIDCGFIDRRCWLRIAEEETLEQEQQSNYEKKEKASKQNDRNGNVFREGWGVILALMTRLTSANRMKEGRNRFGIQRNHLSI